MRAGRVWLRYAVAIAAVLLALALAWQLTPLLGPWFGNIFFLAVLVSAWYGGKGPGFLSTALTLAAALAIRASYGWTFATTQVLGLVAFAAGGLLITKLVDDLQAARRRAEEERQRLEAVLTSIGDAVIATDEHGRVTFMNAVAERLTGWDMSAASGCRLPEVFNIVNEQTRARVEDPVQKVLRTGHIVGLANHTVLIAPDGRETPIDDSAAPIHDREGRTRGVVLVFRDISDRKRAAAERERLAAIVESSEDAIIAKSPEGIILSWNAGAERIFGYTANEIVGQPISTLIPAERADDFPLILERLRRGERVKHYITQRVRKDGQVIDVSLTVSPIRDAAGNLIGASKIARDITERLRAERLLREAKETAEAANRAKDQFLAALSHELRTPLNPVLLALTSMLDDYQASGDIRPTLEMIRHNVELEARLIDDLLDVMRIVRGKLALHREVANVHDLIERSVEICRSELHGKQQRLELDLSADAPHVNADATRLQQVFWNLLRNAIKFTPGGGTITLRTRNIPGTDSACSPGLLVAEVSDTGIGIDAEFLPRVFDAFEQGQDSVARRYGGLGLGLAISRSIVEAHGGKLAAASGGKDRGSTFTLVLPSIVAPETRTPAAPDGTPAALTDSRTGLKILLVEDDETTLRLLARLLEGLGHQVTRAATLAAARQKAETAEMDLVISDLGLPDGSGLDLMREIRTARPVPAIALTGYGMDEDLRRSREAGFDEHLTKPVNFRTLEGIIVRLSRRGSAHASASDHIPTE